MMDEKVFSRRGGSRADPLNYEINKSISTSPIYFIIFSYPITQLDNYPKDPEAAQMYLLTNVVFVYFWLKLTSGSVYKGV
jgi:hypothetical protein